MGFTKRFFAWGLTIVVTGASIWQPSLFRQVSTEAKAETTVGFEEENVSLPTDDLEMEAISYTKESAEAAEEVSISKLTGQDESEIRSTSINSSGNGYDRYGYDALSANQQKMYDDLDTAFEKYVATDEYKTQDYTSSSDGSDKSKTYIAFSMDKKLSEYGLTSVSEGLQVYFTYRNNNPEYYWISTQFYNYGSTNSKLSVIIDDYYAESAARRAQAEESIQAGIVRYKSLVQSYTSTYDKVKVVHDQLVDDVEYAYNTPGVQSSSPADAIWAHSIAGAFTNRPGYTNKKEIVCEGYAKTFQLILQELGIENVYIVGKAKGGGHAWNAVKLDDGSYHYFDVTWDDIGTDDYDGRSYLYFSAPKTFFEKDHSAQTVTGNVTKGEWLYTLPSMSEDFEYTYFSKYNMYFKNASSVDEVKTKLNVAAAMSIPSANDTRYFHILVATENDLDLVLQALGNMYYRLVSGYQNGYATITYTMGAFGIQTPATSISLDKTEAELDCATETLTLTATISPSGSDDAVMWSATGSGKVKFSKTTGTTTTITFKGAGSYTVTATAASGKVSASCAVTTTDSGVKTAEHVFVDSEHKTLATNEDATVYANGANKKDKVTKEISYYKSKTFYTDLAAPTYKNAKGKSVAGKLLIGVTTSDEAPTLVKNKIPADADAKKIASASYKKKTGTITVTAKASAGSVYVWIVQLAGTAVMDVGCLPVEVIPAPTKLEITDKVYTDSDAVVYKKDTVRIGDSVNLYLRPTIAKSKTLVETASYKVTAASGMENYVTITELGSYGYRVTAMGLKNNKKTNVKVVAECIQNNKKATFTMAIENPVKGHMTVSTDSDLVTVSENDQVITGDSSVGQYVARPVTVKAPTLTSAVTATVNLTPILSSNDYSMTDKPKVYTMATEKSFTVTSKGKIKVTSKPSGNNAKIKASLASAGNSNVLTIKAPKKLPNTASTYILVAYNTYQISSTECNYGYIVIPVTFQ